MFVLVHVIVGVRVDMFLCLCVFMFLCRDRYTKGCMCPKCVLYFSGASLHGWSLLAPSGRVPACILVVCAAPFLVCLCLQGHSGGL